MTMERLKHMKESLMSCVEGQMGNLREVDTKELGEAIDMIKDLEEAIYYCSITKAMEKSEQEEKWKRDMDRYEGRMYYPRERVGRDMDPNSSPRDSWRRPASSGGKRESWSESEPYEYEYPFELRDEREGRSGKSRRMYMESKELNKDKATKMRDLEKYMKELSEDITEMIEDATPEEKQLLEKKISTLATKIGQP